ncbi:hypothetical protein BDZ90DRAFT_232024 [Jaminaea rosea]|uniref:Uncharacterized protein n=1 Tax=Jaminaea rosea TaxID=1569628 RepID=A0A316UQM7_9BASI|nr:hypothetical protein BDZ90DRAFT_232024 [Jaminaea rosea]PWN27596.1 hypothetical protein BDZ90DRAFT_232024 [Jaminaea rosea]
MAARQMRATASTLRATAKAGPSSRRLAAPSSRRSFHASPARKDAAHSSGGHGSEEYAPETFATPFWRNIFLFTLGGFGLYRFSLLGAETHSTRQPGGDDLEHEEGNDDKRPFLTRYIENYTTSSDTWKQNQERHLELSKQAAERKLFLQDAEMAPVRRMRYIQTFQQASPHLNKVGDQVDLSDLEIRKANE